MDVEYDVRLARLAAPTQIGESPLMELVIRESRFAGRFQFTHRIVATVPELDQLIDEIVKAMPIPFDAA